MNRYLRTTLVVAAFAALSLSLSACVALKPESQTTSQPGGIGDVSVDFTLCSAAEVTGYPSCGADNNAEEAQVILALVLPKGVTDLPDTITATPTTGPSHGPIVFRRNQSVEAQLNADSEVLPPGSAAIGYLSDAITETNGDEFEWGVKVPVGLPPAADGGSFAGPLKYLLFTGWRRVGPTLPASRPVDCEQPSSQSSDTFCSASSETEFGTSDLRIKPPTAAATAYPGATVQLPFGLDFATSATAPPSSFNLGATTAIPGGAATPSGSGFAIGAVDPTSKRFVGQRQVAVSVPAKAKAGTYAVQLTATATAGGTATGVGQLTVIPVKIGIKAKLDKAKGTATLTLKLPAAGSLIVAGKGIVKVKRKIVAAKTLKVVVKTTGKAKKSLAAAGKVKVTAKVKFQPTGAAAATKSKTLNLKLAP